MLSNFSFYSGPSGESKKEARNSFSFEFTGFLQCLNDSGTPKLLKTQQHTLTRAVVAFSHLYVGPAIKVDRLSLLTEVLLSKNGFITAELLKLNNEILF